MKLKNMPSISLMETWFYKGKIIIVVKYTKESN